MSLKNSLQRIKNFLLERYGDNLAGILIFGSANTGEFVEGKSDIDNMIFLKEQKGTNLQDEMKFLIDKLKSENFATQYFHTIEGIKDYLKKRSSWSTYATIITDEGSKTLYTTPEFEETRRWLKENPPSDKGLRKYIQRKDGVELEGYFKDIRDFRLMKAIFAHLRRKLQMINYFENQEVEFNYEKCLNQIDIDTSSEKKLIRLKEIYKKRDVLSDEEVEDYSQLAREFTKRIINHPK